MDMFEAVKARQSVRAYQAKEIEPDKLQAILAAVNQAPSAGDLQAYEVYLVRDGETKRALAKAALGQDFIAQAPMALVFAANPARATARYGSRGEQLYCVQDATVAVAYAQLAATALGLATCWVGAFEDEEVTRIMKLPAGQRPVAILPVGYAAETPRRTPRRALTDIVHEHPGR
ncbi:MAG: nitroreductase family protein [Verrucomicrobia bacterium]|nr:nitroreductase family protein [Verrucomicrobiota bacterium]